MSSAIGRPARVRRALGVLGAVLGAAAAVAALVAMLISTGVLGGGLVAAEDLDRVLVVAASPDENGEVVGQIVFVADLTADPVAITPVSTTTKVTIPGTTYNALADVYPFTGGAGTAEAYAELTGEEPLPYMALDPASLAAVITEAGGMLVNISAPIAVFDGAQMFDFTPGVQTLSAAELAAVLKGAPYLGVKDRELLDAQLASGLARALGKAPDALTDAAATNLGTTAKEKLAEALSNLP